MKAITIHQPWAHLLVMGQKIHETRSWKTSHRGPIAIHAARKFTEDMRNLCGLSPFHESLSLAPKKLPLGSIIGVVNLVDCIPAEELELAVHPTREEQFGDFRPGRWAWKMEQPRLLEVPIPYQGKLGLFDVPNDLFQGNAILMALINAVAANTQK